MKVTLSILFLVLFGVCNTISYGFNSLLCLTSEEGCLPDNAVETEDAEETVFELDETASVTDAMGGKVSLNYPSGWNATASDGAGVITLVGEGATQILTVTFLPEMMASALGDSPADLLETMSASFAGTMTNAEIGEIVETELDGNEAAHLMITLSGIETLYYVMSIDDGYIFAVGTGLEQGLFEAIILTVEYEA